MVTLSITVCTVCVTGDLNRRDRELNFGPCFDEWFFLDLCWLDTLPTLSPRLSPRFVFVFVRCITGHDAVFPNFPLHPKAPCSLLGESVLSSPTRARSFG